MATSMDELTLEQRLERAEAELREANELNASLRDTVASQAEKLFTLSNENRTLQSKLDRTVEDAVNAVTKSVAAALS